MVDDAAFNMSGPFSRLLAYVQAIADEADVPMEIMFGADEPGHGNEGTSGGPTVGGETRSGRLRGTSLDVRQLPQR